MKEYVYDSQLNFVLDEDGDSFESFQKSTECIEQRLSPNTISFRNGYFDESNGYFIKDNITVYLEYSNWTGTVLRVSETYSPDDLNKARLWAAEIHDYIHGSNSLLNTP